MTESDIQKLNELIKPRTTTLSDGRVILGRPEAEGDACSKCALYDKKNRLCIVFRIGCGYWFFEEVKKS